MRSRAFNMACLFLLCASQPLTAQDTALVRRVRVATDSLRGEASRRQGMRVTVVRRLANRIDSLVSAKPVVVPPAPPVVVEPTPEPAPIPTPVPVDTARFDGAAELPRATVAIPTPAPTRVIRVAAGGNLQLALDTARRGDELRLASGATYTGNFKLPAKVGTIADGWVTITSDTSLPAPGTRVTPATAAGFAKIRSPNIDPPIETRRGASGWRLVGLDVSTSASVTQSYGLVVLDAPYQVATLADVPADVILERMYVHGHATLDVARCVSLQSARSAVVDSYLSDCHARGTDAQAIAGWGGPGPYRIENNYLEGSGEVLLFGGADPAIDQLSPSDITVRGNTVTRPMAWRGVWLVKNLVELKHAKRVLFERNIFSHHWPAGQGEHAFVFVSLNQDGGRGAWTTVQDVVFRDNRIDSVSGLFNLSARYDGTETPGARVTIRNNLANNVGGGAFGGPTAWLLQGGMRGVTIEGNTVFGAGWGISSRWFQLGGPEQYPDLVFRRNLGGMMQYTFISPIANDRDVPVRHGIPGANFAGNCVVMEYPQYGPAGNVLLSSFAAAMLDAQLRPLAGSPCAGAGADATRLPGVFP